MTVKELKEKLEKMNDDAIVLVAHPHKFKWNIVLSVEEKSQELVSVTGKVEDRHYAIIEI